MPAPPYQYLSLDAPVLDLTDLAVKLQTSDEQRQEAFDKSRKFQRSFIEAQTDLNQNKGNALEWIQTLSASLVEAIGTQTNNEEEDTTGRVPRVANLNQRVEDLCRYKALHHFFETGRMLPPSACSFSETTTLTATDEEYLAGACMGVAQDLSRYAMGRATARDFASVQKARDIIQEILEYLLQFDFRNGFLRRKYDGTKYALKVRKTTET
jgi:predicted translin family RNA/ssDNA-binding protein